MGVPEANLNHFLRCACNNCSWGLSNCWTTYSWLMVLPKQVFLQGFFYFWKRKTVQALSDLTCYNSRKKKVSHHPALLFNNKVVFVFLFSGGQLFFFFLFCRFPLLQSKIFFLSFFVLSPIESSEGDRRFTSWFLSASPTWKHCSCSKTLSLLKHILCGCHT